MTGVASTPATPPLIDRFGRKVSGADLLAAFDACHLANLRLVELFHQVPLLLTPTVAGRPGPAGGNGIVDGEETPAWVAFTYPFNMTRSPAGTVCAGFTSDGLPVGLQVVGPQHADVAVLRLLAVLEDELAPRPHRPDLSRPGLGQAGRAPGGVWYRVRSRKGA